MTNLIKFLTKTAFLASFVKRFKPHLLFILISATSLLIVSLIHDDFIIYSDVSQNNKDIGVSFIVKWAASAALVFISYILTFKIMFRSSSAISLSNTKLSTTKTDNLKQCITSYSSSDEKAFSKIRPKDKLRSKADIILEKYKNS